MKKKTFDDLWNRMDNDDDDLGYSSKPRVTVLTSKTAQLPYPSYTDERFDEPQTVYGREVKGIQYDYDDRLWQWDYAKSEKAYETAKAQKKPLRTVAYYEAYLSAYYEKDIEIVHLMAGVNRSNGYPYYIFGWKEK